MKDPLEKLATKSTTNTFLTEEATKTALIMPFLMTLGWDVFDPTEVIPEFTTDVGTKKGEKVDYAICQDGEVIMLIEAKKVSSKLSSSSQLYRYFSVTKARIAILTNGVVFKFFSDLDEPNKMDPEPFFEVNLHHLSPLMISFLENFRKGSWNLESILANASEMKFRSNIERALQTELRDPSEALLKHFFHLSHPKKRWTNSIREAFKKLFLVSVSKMMESRVEERLYSALEANVEEEKPEIETTTEELEAFRIIQGVLSPFVAPHRVHYRDSKKWFFILLDDLNKKVVCKLSLSEKRKEVYFPHSKKTVEIMSVSDLYNHKEELREAYDALEPKCEIMNEDEVFSLVQELLANESP